MSQNSNVTKQNIKDMLKIYTAGSVISPRYDVEKATKLLKNMTKLQPLIKATMSVKNLDALDGQLQWIRSHSKKTKSVKYGNTQGIGRFRPTTKATSYVSITRSVRHYLARDLCTDVDIVNAHPVFIEQIYACVFGEECPNLKQWNSNREDIFKELQNMTALNGGIVDIDTNKRRAMTRDDCKEIAYSFLYSTYPKSMEKLFKSFDLQCNGAIYDLCNGLTITSAKLIQYFKTEHADFWFSINGNSDKDNLDGSRFSTLIQHVECHIARQMDATAKRLSFGVDDFCHDGLLLNKDGRPLTDEDFIQYKKEVERDIFNYTGFRLEILKKEMPMPEWAESLDNGTMPNPTVDIDKLREYIPNTDTLDLNLMKKDAFPDLSEYEIEQLADMVAGKYCIRVASEWYTINISTRELTRKFSRTSFQDYTSGTILHNMFATKSIVQYESIVFQDPELVRPTQWNCFGQLRYDRNITDKLSAEQLTMIEPFLYHIRDILCAGNLELYHFLLNIWKFKLLRPFEVSRESGRFLLLVGRQGCGKTSALEKFFKSIFGEEYVNTSAPYAEVVSGGFTDAITNKLVVIMNEIPQADASHRQLHNNFKAMITDSSRRSRQMYQPGTTVPNTIMYIGTSNNRDCYKAEEGDRRTIITEVSAKHKGEHAYFKKLDKCITEYYLLIAQFLLGFEHVDEQGNCLISETIPETSMSIHARELGLCPVGRFLGRALTDKTLTIDEGWTHGRSALHKLYKEYCKREEGIKGVTLTLMESALFNNYFIDNKQLSNKTEVFILRAGHKEALHRAVCWSGCYDDDSTATATSSSISDMDGAFAPLRRIV